MCCASMDCWGMCCIIPFPNRNHRSRTPLLLTWEINSRGSDICTVPLVNHIREEHFLVVSCRKLKNYIFHCSFHKALAIVHKTLCGTLSDSTFAVFAFPLHSRLSFHLLSLALCKQYLIYNKTVWFCPCLGCQNCFWISWPDIHIRWLEREQQQLSFVGKLKALLSFCWWLCWRFVMFYMGSFG